LIFHQEHTMTNEDIDHIARKRANAKLGWLMHAAIYLIVNAFLVALSLWHGRAWAAFPLLGWGLGLAIHGVAVWFAGAGSALREGLVQRERARLTAQRDPW
jgi:2TM domain